MLVKFCKDWGSNGHDMGVVPEAPETMVYTRYVLEKGLSGDLLDLHVALSLCIIGYAEIGNIFKSKVVDNPYGKWIEMYASNDYKNVAKAQEEYLDKLMVNRGGEGRFAAL